MANIINYINNIENAMFGKDVRKSIHDGIVVINEEVESTTERQKVLESIFEGLTINAGSSNAEIVAGRTNAEGKSFDTIGKRLNSFDSQIKDITNINYEMFGAKGDGVTDDFEAIKKAHDYANANNLSIKCDSKATYLIKKLNREFIDVKTNVDFNNCHFIIDDREIDLENCGTPIFKVTNKTNNVVDLTGRLNSLHKNTKHIDILSEYDDVLLFVENNNVKHFIRSGVNKDNGYNQQEIIRVIRGRVISDILWDYDVITKAIVYINEKEKSYFKNGRFKTIINKLPSNYGGGVERGIYVERSNTIIENIIHTLDGEDTTTSKPYNGWLKIKNCCDISFNNSTLTAHKVFKDENKVSMGTYDLNLTTCTNIQLNNVNQSNALIDDTKWGITGTNYIKDIIINDCNLNRFDSHRGCCNLEINNSIFSSLTLIGYGEGIFNNVTVLNTDFIHLREDYGSTWDGTLRLNNCTLRCNEKTPTDLKIVRAVNNSSHNYGYKCYYPNLIVKNFTVENTNTDSILTLIPNKSYNTAVGFDITCELSYEEEVSRGKYPYIFKQFAKFDNIKSNCRKAMFYNYPQICYCEKENSIKYNDGKKDSNNTNPLSVIYTNFDIEVKNTSLIHNISNDYNRGGFIYAKAFERENAITIDNFRMVPNIKIDNVDGCFNLGLYPLIINIDNSIVKNVISGYDDYAPIIKINKSTIGITTTNKIIQSNHKNIYFNECYFLNPKDEQPTLTELKNYYSFFNVIGEYGNYFRISVHMNKCYFNFLLTDVITDSFINTYNIEKDIMFKDINFKIYNRTT